MAKSPPAADEPFSKPEFSETEQRAAREWFKKSAAMRDQRNYDFAIASAITGLGYWPEAVEEGWKPLWSLAIQRQQLGGKKPGMLDAMKKPMTGKDIKVALFNAAHLMAMDPNEGSYLEGVLKNAVKAGFLETIEFIAPKVAESLRKDKKPDVGRFSTFKQAMVEAAEKADQINDRRTAIFLEHAVTACEFQIGRSPGDMKLKDEQRSLAGRLTIAKGNYSEADSFRGSLKDAERQTTLHDSERVKQSEQTLQALIENARREYAANPSVQLKLYALVDLLLKTEAAAEENEAVKLLTQAFAQSQNYSFKMKSDDVLLRQLRRQTRALKEKADAPAATDDDRQQLRLAQMEESDTKLNIMRERSERYPTDLRVKFQLGEALFQANLYDEAIPILQAAQGDPRNRTRALALTGRAFFEKEQFDSAAEVLKEALDGYELSGDEMQKRLLDWLGQAYEKAGKVAEAKEAYGKLVRMDYNYANGAVRKRLETLK